MCQLLILSFSINKETHYNYISLFFNKMKSTILRLNIKAEIVRNARKECNDAF